MKNEANKGLLLPFVTLLRQCPSRDESISHSLLLESWDRLRNDSLNHVTQPTPAIMAALVLHDRAVGQLLTDSEREQLLALAHLARERYEQRHSARNQLGNLIAGILKEPQ